MHSLEKPTYRRGATERTQQENEPEHDVNKGRHSTYRGDEHGDKS